MSRFKTSIRVACLLSLATAAGAANYTAWTGKKIITLNTSSTGANVAGTVTNFPVLIRLGANESAILSAAGGQNIRFSKADSVTALPYQIESWTSTSAAIWVKVDTVKGNNSTQSIILHYGNGSATSESNGAAVFDTANGFRGVWHLGDSTGAKSVDATVLNTNAKWGNGPKLVSGLIGSAVDVTQPEDLSFQTARYLQANYDTTTHNFKATSAAGITLSTWVKRTANTGNAEQGILGRYNWGTNGRQAMIALNGSDQIRLFRSLNGTNASGQETNFGSQTISDGVWTHIVATVRNGAQVLYVNGVKADSQATANIGSLDSVWATKSHLAFGRMAPDNTNTGNSQAFSGVMDEARFTVVARSADWVKLEFENQKALNSLVNIGQPTAPVAPTAVTGVPGNAQVTVSWTASASDGGSPITAYKAMTATPDTSKSCVTTGTTCTITGLTNGTAYTFQVKAINLVGASAPSTATGSISPVTTAPAAPTGVSGVAGPKNSGSVIVSWTAPSNNGGSAITGYKAMTAGADTNKSCTAAGTATTCTITGLTAGAVYTFQVRATNAIGTSGLSNASPAVSAPVPVLPGAMALSVGRFSKPYTFVLPEAAAAVTEKLTLTISDVHGRKVWEKTVSPAASNVREIAWNGVGSNGRKVSSGMYFVGVKTSGEGLKEESIRMEIKVRQD